MERAKSAELGSCAFKREVAADDFDNVRSGGHLLDGLLSNAGHVKLTAGDDSHDLNLVSLREIGGGKLGALHDLPVPFYQDLAYGQTQLFKQFRYRMDAGHASLLSIQNKIHTARIEESQSFQTGSRFLARIASATSEGDRSSSISNCSSAFELLQVELTIFPLIVRCSECAP